MGKPVTLLKSLCAHALNLDSQTLVVEHSDGREWIFIEKSDGAAVRVANWASSSSNAEELLANLRATAAKPARTMNRGAVYIPKVRIFESNGHDAFKVRIDPAPKLDSSVAPKFTATQGQYLASIYSQGHHAPRRCSSGGRHTAPLFRFRTLGERDNANHAEERPR